MNQQIRRGNVCLLFSVLYGSVPSYKMFFCCFELYKLFQNLLRKWQSKNFWKLSRIKHQQNVNKKTEPLIEYCFRLVHKNGPNISQFCKEWYDLVPNIFDTETIKNEFTDKSCSLLKSLRNSKYLLSDTLILKTLSQRLGHRYLCLEFWLQLDWWRS